MGQLVYSKLQKFTLLQKLYLHCAKIKQKFMSDRSFYEITYKSVFGKELNIKSPKRLNEKIQWLKLNDRKDFYTICADKYAVRTFLAEEFGEEYLIPLLFHTTNVDEININNLPNCKCIVKANHDSGHYQIIRDKHSVNYDELRMKCSSWLAQNYYDVSREWQYKNIKPRRILVEELLETSSGKLPNDYKLHYINGELQFVYVSFDREGVNDRCTYDRDWNRLPFVWVPKDSYRSDMNKANVPKPKSFDKMVEFADKIASRFKYVRVDFYDVDGKLYFGEITLHHGSGFDLFFPDDYDFIYGEKLNL